MAPTTSAATRILHITRNLPPLVGGMERLNWHIADELSRYAQVQLIGPEGSSALRPTAVQVTEVPLRPLPRFLLASAWQAVAVARRFRPPGRGPQARPGAGRRRPSHAGLVDRRNASEPRPAGLPRQADDGDRGGGAG